MAIEIAIEVASKAVDLLIVPVGRQIDYAWNCVDHINNLRGEVKTLKESKDRLQHSVKEAKKRREKIRPDVEEWLKDTNQFIERVDEFLQAEDSVNKKCFRVLCPDCKTKYQRGRKAKKEMLKEVADLCKKGRLRLMDFSTVKRHKVYGL